MAEQPGFLGVRVGGGVVYNLHLQSPSEVGAGFSWKEMHVVHPSGQGDNERLQC